MCGAAQARPTPLWLCTTLKVENSSLIAAVLKRHTFTPLHEGASAQQPLALREAPCASVLASRQAPWSQRRNLVDPASSHTLVSKIKPCMSKYKHYTVKLRMAHYISYSLFDSPCYLDNRSNSRANTCIKQSHGCVFIRYNQPPRGHDES